MTYIEKYMAEHPQEHDGSVIMWDCPIMHFDGFKRPDACEHNDTPFEICKRCWYGEYIEEKSEEESESKNAVKFGEALAEGFLEGYNDPLSDEQKKELENIQQKIYEVCGIASPGKEITNILDSGNRREFETGAVRDIQEGKGRCDLMPLDVVGHLMYDDPFIFQIYEFTQNGDPEHLICALQIAAKGNGYPWLKIADMILECAKHFEEGAKKYGESNWQKGIPTHCYIDSAVRHYLKYARGDTDEPHDRAFVWNLLCCIWTCKHKPELNDYAKKDK